MLLSVVEYFEERVELVLPGRGGPNITSRRNKPEPTRALRRQPSQAQAQSEKEHSSHKHKRSTNMEHIPSWHALQKLKRTSVQDPFAQVGHKGQP